MGAHMHNIISMSAGINGAKSIVPYSESMLPAIRDLREFNSYYDLSRPQPLQPLEFRSKRARTCLLTLQHLNKHVMKAGEMMSISP
jgi:endonuclease I